LAASVVSPPANSPDKAKSGRRPTNKDAIGNDKWQALESEAPSRRRLAPEKKQQIENLLIEGIPVADIVAQMKVSNPTIYVIKARLKKEGRL
jgi:DNA invertase Pin-like site-specific DNA recombinase